MGAWRRFKSSKRPTGGLMTSIRAFFGSKCPDCRADILQAAPSNNRMPGEEKAWCPRCDHRFTADQLSRKAKPGLLKRLFGAMGRSESLS